MKWRHAHYGIGRCAKATPNRTAGVDGTPRLFEWMPGHRKTQQSGSEQKVNGK